MGADLKMDLKNAPGKPMGVMAKIDPSWIAILKDPAGKEPWEMGQRLPNYKDCQTQCGEGVGALENTDLNATYTIEYYTANLDFKNWQITGIKVMPAAGLDNFFPQFPHVEKTTAIACCFRERVSADDDFLVKPKQSKQFGGYLLVNKP